MTNLISLDENDLVYVLADYFDVGVEDVDLIPFITTEGYGMNEHDALSVRAEIDTKEYFVARPT
jgi:hypothetical protein